MANNLFSNISPTELDELINLGAQLAGENEAKCLTVSPEGLIAVMNKLRDTETIAADYLADVTAVDRGEAGFEVVYQVFSIPHQAKGSVKVGLTRENPCVPSVVSVWPGANWLEREVYDLMGIEFSGHPCLERILLYEDFIGHPLRKDFRMSHQSK
jgi:NADH-quinone oxidoreductase subunit C